MTRHARTDPIPLRFHDQPIGTVTSVEETDGGLLVSAKIESALRASFLTPNPWAPLLPPPRPLTRRQRWRYAISNRWWGLRERIARRIYPMGFHDDDDY